ncbi:MAG: protein phosphatase 1 regulatory subunit 16A-like [Rickettsiaceae bacterium]|jgi:ankyrin repeat protein|nr:protein phosphatase 1 regulatory subunit 16A-like [Rickettsiaceae bacterium]
MPIISDLIHYAATNNVKKVEEILQKGQVKINETTEEGLTALHYAASNNAIDVMKLLIQKGANVNALDKGEYTPLHLTTRKFNENTFKLLVNSGAEILAKVKNYRIGEDLYENQTILSDPKVISWLKNELYNSSFSEYNKLGKTQLNLAAHFIDESKPYIVKYNDFVATNPYQLYKVETYEYVSLAGYHSND